MASLSRLRADWRGVEAARRGGRARVRRTLRSGELLYPTSRVPVWPSYTCSPAASSAPTDAPEGARVRVLLPAPVARRFERFDAVDV